MRKYAHLLAALRGWSFWHGYCYWGWMHTYATTPLLLSLLIAGLCRAGSLADNARFSWDLSTRATHASNAAPDWNFRQDMGFDFHTVATAGSRDLATLTLQGSLTRIDNNPRPSPLFDDGDDWEFFYRTFELTIHLPGRLSPDLAFGHMVVPYGVEHHVDTTGTLLQYGLGPRLGLKADWGVALRDELTTWEYALMLGRGSGAEYRDTDKPYTWSGRIGTARHKNTTFGISAFYGDVRNPNGIILSRRAVSLDARHQSGPIALLGQIGRGSTTGRRFTEALLEVDLQSPTEAHLLYTQLNHMQYDSHEDSILTIGSKHRLTHAITLSVQYVTALAHHPTTSPSDLLQLQLRCRF